MQRHDSSHVPVQMKRQEPRLSVWRAELLGETYGICRVYSVGMRGVFRREVCDRWSVVGQKAAV